MNSFGSLTSIGYFKAIKAFISHGSLTSIGYFKAIKAFISHVKGKAQFI